MARINDILAENLLTDSLAANNYHRIMPGRVEATELTLACEPDDFCASAIARAVEETNAHLLNLNLTSEVLSDGRCVVEIRTSSRTHDVIQRALFRYGYEVIAVNSSTDTLSASNESDLQLRAAELLHILEL